MTLLKLNKHTFYTETINIFIINKMLVKHDPKMYFIQPKKYVEFTWK